MKVSFLILFTFCILINASAQKDDSALVHAAVEDYVEALYKVEPERIKRSVHPNMTKKGFARKDQSAPFGPELTMTYQELYDLAGKWNANNTLPADAPKEIIILDVQDQTAAAKLTAQWGTDYFHLAKYNGTWMITNVLWQTPPASTKVTKK
jgi:hypothetical protein